MAPKDKDEDESEDVRLGELKAIDEHTLRLLNKYTLCAWIVAQQIKQRGKGSDLGHSYI
jgi:hypothetical protein